ncbi:MAG: hypothetical protein GY913_00650 [Proteobacteria bacterium]|nr:hypothetical protein [Pseudomonadota bacterium]
MRYHLRVSTRFFAPLEDVWRAKTDVDKLEDELHPWLRARIDQDKLQRGLRGEDVGPVDIRFMFLGVIPAPAWELNLTEFRERQEFVDVSENAVFSQWEHRHIVQQTDDAVRYLDAITFTPRRRPTRWVARFVEELFIHRHKRTARHFETDARATAASFLRTDPILDEDGGAGFM